MGSTENVYEKDDCLKAFFRKAFEICDIAKNSESDDEYIAMIAEGRINEIPPSERSRILDIIAADPESAMLLKRLSDMGICSSAVARQSGTVRKLAISWAAAACIMVGLFAWKTMDRPVPPSHFHDTAPYSVQQDSPDYWSQLDQHRFSLSQIRSRYRDYALIVSTSTTLVLSVLAAAVLLRRPKKRCGGHRNFGGKRSLSGDLSAK